MFGALLGLAGTLIGASKQEKARKRSDYNNSPQGIRANAEEAGFNPLVFAGPGVGTGAQYAPTMGTTIANGFALAGEQFQQEQVLKQQKAELEQETQRLQKVVEQTTLTPNVPGVYGNAHVSNRGGDGASGAGNIVSQRQGAPDHFGTPKPPVNEYQGGSVGTVTGPGGTDVMTNKGLLESLSPYYGDEVPDFLGAMNFARDYWKGTVKGEVYHPGWGWESEIVRPQSRPKKPNKKEKRGDRRKKRTN